MNNEKICNPKVDVEKGMVLNDKDYITCLLSTLKDMVKNYTISMTEASNEELYNTYKESFLELISLQREVFEIMFRHGWYCLEKQQQTKINEKFQMLLQEYQDLDS